MLQVSVLLSTFVLLSALIFLTDTSVGVAAATNNNIESIMKKEKRIKADEESHVYDNDKASTLVGTDVDEALQYLKSTYPHFHIAKVSKTSMMTMDFRQDRIRVFYDENNNVSRAPMPG